MRSRANPEPYPAGSRGYWPVLRDQPIHGEVRGVAGSQPAPDRPRCRRDKTVGLCEGDSPRREVSPPGPCLLTLGSTKHGDLQAVEQASGSHILPIAAQSACHLLDVDGTDDGPVSRSPQLRETSGRAGSAAQEVDEDRRIEKDGGHSDDWCGHSADAAGVCAPLRANPCRGVGVPLMNGLRQRADGSHEGLPSLLIIECASYRLCDEAAATARADSCVEAPHVVLPQRYVHAHGHNLAHWVASSECHVGGRRVYSPSAPATAAAMSRKRSA